MRSELVPGRASRHPTFRVPGRWRLGGTYRGGEPGNACDFERAEKLIEWPGWVEVGCPLLERRSNSIAAEVVEIDQEVVRVDRFDAERLARGGWEVVEVEGDDELGVRGDCGCQDVGSFGSFVIAGSSRSISARSTSASSNAPRIAVTMRSA